jgi:hypothetical protein
MYSEAEASRLLRVAQSTLNYWLEGGVRRGKTYKPIIRPEPKGGRAAVTWAEFIEAGLLREYRRRHNVPMAELRAFIDHLLDRYRVPYPLAHERPFVAARRSRPPARARRSSRRSPTSERSWRSTSKRKRLPPFHSRRW